MVKVPPSTRTISNVTPSTVNDTVGDVWIVVLFVPVLRFPVVFFGGIFVQATMTISAKIEILSFVFIFLKMFLTSSFVETGG